MSIWGTEGPLSASHMAAQQHSQAQSIQEGKQSKYNVKLTIQSVFDGAGHAKRFNDNATKCQDFSDKQRKAMKIKFLVSKCNGHTIQYTARHTESNKATSNNLLAFKYCWKGHDNSILRKLHCQWAESVVGIENYTLEQRHGSEMFCFCKLIYIALLLENAKTYLMA